MPKGFRASQAVIFLRVGGLGLIFIGLIALAGCQGFSSSKPAVQQQSGALVIGSVSLDFGSVTEGTSKTLTASLSNTGTTSVTISSIAIFSQYFSLSGPGLPVTIAAGQNSTISLVFTPNAAGAFSATVSLTSNASNVSTTLSLSGTGLADGQLAVSPTIQSFGSVAVGSQSNQTVTLTNNGASTVNLSQVSVTGTGFKLSGVTTPIALNTSQSTTFSVAFAPQSIAAASGSVTITSNASNPMLIIPLSGTGVAEGALGSSFTSLAFGSLQVGKNEALSEMVTNTGGSSVIISQVGISGTGFSLSGITTPLTLGAGQSTSFTASFNPQSAGNSNGSVTITSNAPNPTLTIPVSGTGVAAGALGSSPTSLAFGSVQVGNNQALSGTVTNTGGSSVIISQMGISGTGFSLSGITTPLTLGAGQSTSFSVSFTPQSAGSDNGSVTITSNGSNPALTIPLAGTGVAAGALGSSPTSLAFGSLQVGNNRVLSATVTNTGGSSVIISQVGISGTGFSLSGITTPLTLGAGQSTSFTASFNPQSAGNSNGSVTITSNASNPTLTIPVSGTGVAAGALGSSPTSLAFGSVQVGNNQALSGTVTNTGGSSVIISQMGISGTGFTLSGITTPVTLGAGQSASFSVSFTPASAGSGNGSVTITSNASNPTLTIPVSGTGVAAGVLGSSPTSLAFGSVQVGNNQALSGTVTNTGGSSVIISQMGISGPGFSLSGITTPLTLGAGQSTSFSVSFTPQSAGSDNGSVTITSNGSNPTLNLPLSGTGMAAAGQLTPTPSTLAVASVVIGTSGTASGSLVASGASVTVTAVSTSNSQFTVGGLALPITIPAGQSAAFTITFSPLVSGAASGVLTFTSNAQSSAATETLTGTGTPAPTHTVNLSWSASSSPDISGYNIYRAVYLSSCGAYSKINGSALDTVTTYSDTSVADGTNYCYATTAVNSNNEESGYSNIVSDIQIPAP